MWTTHLMCPDQYFAHSALLYHTPHTLSEENLSRPVKKSPLSAITQNPPAQKGKQGDVYWKMGFWQPKRRPRRKRSIGVLSGQKPQQGIFETYMQYLHNKSKLHVDCFLNPSAVSKGHTLYSVGLQKSSCCSRKSSRVWDMWDTIRRGHNRLSRVTPSSASSSSFCLPFSPKSRLVGLFTHVELTGKHDARKALQISLFSHHKFCNYIMEKRFYILMLIVDDKLLKIFFELQRQPIGKYISTT